jgi:hypothetical protein
MTPIGAEVLTIGGADLQLLIAEETAWAVSHKLHVICRLWLLLYVTSWRYFLGKIT